MNSSKTTPHTIRPCEESELRHSRRVATERPVKVFIEGDVLQGKMIDLSNLGSGVLIKSEPPTQTHVDIEFSLPSSPDAPIRLSGHIIHNCRVRQETLIGVRFDAIPPKHQAKINDFMNHKY